MPRRYPPEVRHQGSGTPLEAYIFAGLGLVVACVIIYRLISDDAERIHPGLKSPRPRVRTIEFTPGHHFADDRIAT
jgi:hypothetical protein